MKTTNILKLFTLFLMFFTLQSAYSQFRWVAGGANNDDAYCIINTTDGGYAVAGYTQSYGLSGSNAYILKLSSSGTIQWSKVIGLTGTDVIYSIIQTSDGGYAATGWTNSSGAGGYDLWFIRLDPSGNILLNKTVGGTDNDFGLCIIQASTLDFVIAGYTNSYGAGSTDIFLVKINIFGIVQWCKTTGGSNIDYAYSLIKTSDGSYVIGGKTASYGAGNFDMILSKFDDSGNLLWNRFIGGTGDESCGSLLQTSDGSFVLAGETYTYGAGSSDMYVVKVNSTGSIVWSRTIGGTNTESGTEIIQSTDGGYIVSGATNSFGAGNYDFYVIKLNSSGVIQWQKTVGGSNNDYCISATQTSNGYVVAGYTASFGAGNDDMFITKLDLNGVFCGNYSSPNGSSASGGSIGSLLTPSFSQNPVTNSPVMPFVSGSNISILCLTGVEPIANEIPDGFRLNQNYPNPFNPSTKIKFSVAEFSQVELKVYDVSGKEVSVLVNEEMNPGVYEADFNAMNLTSGVYFYTMKTGSFSETKKMMLVK